MEYGYVRVSAKDQNIERQMIAMQEYGVDKKRIFLDKQSGKDFNRPQYQNLIHKLKAGDVVVIKSIDRLGRNYDDILDQWRQITKEKDCDIVVLDMPLLDTTKDNANGLMGKVIADIVLQLLSYVAQTEREFIRQRQAEGIAAYRAAGHWWGRPPIHRGEDYLECYQLWRDGQLSGTQAGKRLGMHRTTFLKYAREDEAREIKEARNDVADTKGRDVADGYQASGIEEFLADGKQGG